MFPIQGSSEARLHPRRKGAAGQGDCSSYAGMNRVKFAGVILSTDVHPGAGAMLTRNGGLILAGGRRSLSLIGWGLSAPAQVNPFLGHPSGKVVARAVVLLQVIQFGICNGAQRRQVNRVDRHIPQGVIERAAVEHDELH